MGLQEVVEKGGAGFRGPAGGCGEIKGQVWERIWGGGAGGGGCGGKRNGVRRKYRAEAAGIM